MKLTKYRAKQISLEVWGWLAKTGASSKWDLPQKLLKKIINMDCMCPLCECLPNCNGCPLWPCSGDRPRSKDRYIFSKWAHARGEEQNKKYALAIYNKIKAWKVAKPRPKA